MRARERVLCLLAYAKQPISGFMIGQLCHVGSWRLYPLLARLENEKLITSGWVQGLNEDGPRRRAYAIGALNPQQGSGT